MLVKITELNNIGSNISYQTLIPVVDTAGNATTEKANLQIVGNLILNGAGGVNFPRAAQANIALSVANAAQPNITSVGTLTNLTSNGTVNFTNASNVSLGAIGNVKITGGTNGYVLSTDGEGNLSWVDGGGAGSYGNSNVANYLPTYTGNIGNLSFQYANTNGTILGRNGSFLKLFGPDDTILGCDTGNTAVWSNGKVEIRSGIDGLNDKITNFYANGDVEFFDGAILSSGGLYGNSTAVLGNKSGQNQIYAQNEGIGIQTYTGSAYNTWTFDNAGNLVLPGNTFAVKYANGTTVSLGGGVQSQIANGTSNVNIATSGGNVTVKAGSAGNWTFGTDAVLSAPNGSQIVPAGNNFNIYTYGLNGTVQFFTDVSGNNHNWAFDGYGYTYLPFSQGYTDTAVLTSTGAGNLMIQAGAGPAQNFLFGSDGTITFPTLTVDLHNGGNQSAQTLQFGDPSQQAIITGPTPALDTNAQRLIIQGQRGNGTGEGGDVYFWAGDADTNGGDIKIYAGDADNVSAGYGGYINLDGGSGYDGGGQISVNGGYSANGPGGTVNISAGQGGSDGGAVNINGGVTSTNQGGNIALTGGYGGNSGGEVRLTGGSAGIGIPGYGNIVLVSGASTWTFDNTGTLTVPQNINGGGALQLQGLADGNTTINIGSGVGGDIDMVSNLGNINLYTASNQPWIFDQGGNLTAPGAINVGNMSIGGPLAGYITADTNTAIILNANGPDGGFVVDYLKEDGNANTSGGELAFSSELGNATYRISLSDDLGDGFATKIWRFDGTGNLSLPSGGSVYSEGFTPSGAPGNTIILNPHGSGSITNQKLMVYPTAGDGDHIHMTTGNLYQTELFLGSDNFFVKLSNTGNVVVNTNDDLGNSATWTFDTTGNFHLANGNSVIKSVPNNAGDGSGLSTLNLIPDNSTGDDRYLIVDPTGPNHLHLRAGGAQDASTTALYLGGEQNYVQVLDNSGLRLQNQLITVVEHVYNDPADFINATWFTDSGNFYIQYTSLNAQLTNDAYQDINSIFVVYPSSTSYLTYGGSTQSLGGGVYKVKVDQGPPSEPTTLTQINYYINVLKTNFIELDSDGFNVYSEDDAIMTGTSYVQIVNNSNVNPVTIIANNSGSAKTWNFDTTGALTFPSGAGFLAGSANVLKTNDSTTNSLDFRDSSGRGFYTDASGYTLRSDGSHNWVFGTDGNLTAPGAITTTGNISAGNFIGTGSNVEVVAGSNTWNFDNTGNLTLPSNTFAVNYANGTQVSLGSNYGDSNVVTLLGSFGSNNIVTTGNITGNTNGFTIGYLNIPQVAASNTTLSLTDAGKHYYSTTVGNLTLTIPNNATTSFTTGTAISIVVQAAGNVLVNAASGVTLYMAGSSTAGNRAVGTYGMATLIKVASDTWFINGTGVY